MSTLANLKAGDTVFVVWQRSKFSRDEPPRTTCETVTKVGRKYGYIGNDYRPQPFWLHNGHSAHKESNCRANGFGFDVYATEQEWLAKQHQSAERERLKERLVTRWGGLVELPHEAIEAIHKALDKFSEATQ